MLRKAALLLGLAAHGAFAQHSWGTRTDGRPVTALAAPDAKVVVLFFVASDCPVSNRTFPEMKRLRQEFSSQGVSFWFVYPNETEESPDIAAHQASFDAGGLALVAHSADIVALAHAVATPEISVLRPDGNGGWIPAYTGRVDNRFMRFGQERTEVTEHYGEQAIHAVLAGIPAPKPVGTPVGCAIINPGAHSR